MHLTTRNSKTNAHLQTIEILQRNDGAVTVLTGKNIAKALAQPMRSLLRSIARDRTAPAKAKRTKIVYAVAMVCVIVRPKNCVDLLNPAREQLRPQIRRCVYQNTFAFIVLNQDGDARTPVFRLVRITIAPIDTGFRAEPGDTDRCSATEYQQFHPAAFPNNAKKLQVVVSASLSGSTPLNSARNRAVSAV